ncbi:uncharacterized protein LOC118561503 isoform X2 [Fundulus heteroclitus]|uniref:uncharacterized protein LOC118561503 isoform X2 n=1 Tax=Fundulus heteroclitus TaxID=8078 RepID=UPI00165B36D3|nr:uncharacterized protein LOC118561503 isoform X2 [Fundulus heteroclitus]
MSQLPSSRRATTAQNYNDRSTRAPPVIYHPTVSDLDSIFHQNSDFDFRGNGYIDAQYGRASHALQTPKRTQPMSKLSRKSGKTTLFPGVAAQTKSSPQCATYAEREDNDVIFVDSYSSVCTVSGSLAAKQEGDNSQAASLQHPSEEAAPLGLGGEKVKVEPLNPPQTGQKNLGTSSDKAAPLGLGGEKVKVEPLNPPQTGQKNLGTSSDTPTARRGTPTLKRKRQLSNLVKLQSTALRYQKAINKNLSGSIKARRIMIEAVESIQKIPLSGRKGGFHMRKSSELLRTCKCLLDETAKTSTLQ